jgi:hypothetical protein
MLVATVLACLLTPGRSAPAQAPDASAEETPARVIVHVSRHDEVRGVVELEDEDIIVIRKPGGSIQSFTKSRLRRIVRLVDPRPGQTGIVILRDGQQRRGVIIEDDFDHVIVEIEGIRSKLVREVVDYVVLEPTFEERYAQYKKAMKPNQLDLHLELCRWLLAERRYKLTRLELEALLAEAEDRPAPTAATLEIVAEARHLLKIVDAQIALLRPVSPFEPRPGEPGEPDETPLDEKALISPEDVNLIRVYEIDFDHPPKVAIDPDAIKLLIERYGTSELIPTEPSERARLHRADPLDIVRLMFELRARDLYPHVEVLTEPRALNLFRQRVHNAWLIKNCATSRCHSDPEPGGFFLYRKRYKDERVRYTNLLLLERLEVDPVWPLVNYEEPPMSLVIQHGLPRHLARLPHPDVQGWRPVFVDLDSRLLQESVSWIDAMMRPRPVYPVELTLPAGDPDEAGTPLPEPGSGSN